jgi:crotonobetainyl-CoA:carnitine CoA-transferase CaiB-like acyl-CoA transferase
MNASNRAPATGPLAGVRILDLSTVLMAPFATQILGDLGADIIKVEPESGDSLRGIGPFKSPGMGPMFLQTNRNKRSIVLDLKSENGRNQLFELAKEADVFVGNVRPQAMARLGLGYAEVAKHNPSIIYCSAVGYGSRGPDSGKPAYDDIIQAGAGIAGLFAMIEGPPRYAPVNICDRVAGLYITIALLAALHHRTKTGEGQEIEVPMLETMVQFVLGDHMSGGVFSSPISPMGYKRLLSRTRGPYPTKDGHIAIVVYSDQHWRSFTALVGQDGLMDRDPRFKTLEMRTQHAVDMGHFLAEHLPQKTTREWLSVLRKNDIPCSAVNTLEDLLEDPHLKAVGYFQDVDHPTEGRMKIARFPIEFSKTPATVRCLAPNLGEHTDAVIDAAPSDRWLPRK